jgi:hypothetical protein
MLVLVRDAGVFSAEKYGNLAGLANGIRVGLFNDSTGAIVEDWTDGLPVKANVDWGRMCYDVDHKGWGAGDEFIVVRWTFIRAGIACVLAANDNQDYAFGVEIRDDLTGLVEHYFQVQGYQRS